VFPDVELFQRGRKFESLNHKIHRAFNRLRELNFSLSGRAGFDLRSKRAGMVGTGRIGRIVARAYVASLTTLANGGPFVECSVLT